MYGYPKDVEENQENSAENASNPPSPEAQSPASEVAASGDAGSPSSPASETKPSEGEKPASGSENKENTTPAAAQGSPVAARNPLEIMKRSTRFTSTSLKSILKLQKNILLEIPGVLNSLISPDAPTRKGSILFLMSAVGLIGVSGMIAERAWVYHKIAAHQKALQLARLREEEAKHEAEEEKKQSSNISLGTFTWELRSDPKERRPASDTNMAEVEVVLLCDSKDTREYVEENLVKVRNQMTNLLTAVDRDELISKQGKKRIKRVILKRLNEWLTHGSVLDLYFAQLVVD